MKIGIDARMWGPEQTGIGRFIDRLIYHLVQLDHGHDLVFFALASQQEALKKHIEVASQRKNAVTIVPVVDRWYGWGEQLRFPRFLNDACLDLLHVPHFNVPLSYRRPFVTTIHDVTPWLYPGHKMGRSLFRRLLFRRVFRSAIRRARRIMAVSDATRSDLWRVVGKCSIDVVHEGPGIVDMDEPFGVSVEHVSPMSAPYILTLGVWREHKNFERLIAAFERLKQMGGWDDLLLVIGGSWDQGDPAVQHRLAVSTFRNDIITPGFLPSKDLQQWYQHARVVVVPSLLEGFGFVGLEAMHAGTPVVAASTGSLPEIYGDAAYYIDPLSITSMAEGLDRILTDAARRSVLVACGKDQVRRYSWRRMTERVLQIYEEALQS